MPPPPHSATAGLVVSLAVVSVAVVLALRQYREWLGREDDLSEADAKHFARQDMRRGIGVGVMVLLAPGLSIGSRLEPRVGGRTNPMFVPVWLGIFVLIFALLVLALLDLIATRLYARRHRRVLFEERIEALRDEYRHREKPGNGRPGPSESLDGFSS